ncbi:MAG: hypothetical protein IH598_16510 [Bacteroidales bacterium]|nr:hypothetical protein [Bacteroidales bacterium]
MVNIAPSSQRPIAPKSNAQRPTIQRSTLPAPFFFRGGQSSPNTPLLPATSCVSAWQASPQSPTTPA